MVSRGGGVGGWTGSGKGNTVNDAVSSCPGTDGTWAWCGGHTVRRGNVQSLCCTPTADLHANYTYITDKKRLILEKHW